RREKERESIGEDDTARPTARKHHASKCSYMDEHPPYVCARIRAVLTRFGDGRTSTFSVLGVLEYACAPKTPICARLLCDCAPLCTAAVADAGTWLTIRPDR